jgi:sialate O-acetylesterase
MRRLTLWVGLAAVLAIGAQACLLAQETADRPFPFLHPLFTDNVVLQRDIACPVWGWAKPGQKITVSMAEKTSSATADGAGKWLAKLGPFAAGGPYTLTVSGPQTVTLNNVLVGDVWICSGQSNMQFGVAGATNAPQEIADAKYPEIRLFSVPNVVAFLPQSTVNGKWQVCSPETVPGFTAVGYFFGRDLHRDLKVPIGLINSSWGGTICEAWASAEALKTMPDFVKPVEDLQQQVAHQTRALEGFEKQMTDWWAKNDPGSAPGVGWADPAFDPAGWKTMDLPQNWEGAGLPDFDGVVWFRRSVDLPDTWRGKTAVLHLGAIDDRDTTWVNGTKVGARDAWDKPRDYKLPADLLEPGRNTIAVRVLDTGGAGGFHGKPEEMKLEAADGATVSLAGSWLHQPSTPLAKTSPVPQRLDNNPNQVSVLYNAMIAPLTPFAIKGAIWYQGESNAGRAEQYARLLPTMIGDWRARFGVGDFPFLIVQLANFMAVDAEPKDDAWPNLRWSQWLTTKALPKVGLALAIDIGDAGDIHPKNKQDVGHRLALAALGITYGRDTECSGPVYRAMARPA